MIEEMWECCKTCEDNCCIERNLDMITPVFEADIVHAKTLDLVKIESPDYLYIETGAGMLSVDYYPIGYGVWGKLRRIENRCIQLKDDKSCNIHDLWRPIMCSLYPFLPVWNKRGVGYESIVYTGCKPISFKLEGLKVKDRLLLYNEVRTYFDTFEPYRIAAVRYYTESLSRKVFI